MRLGRYFAVAVCVAALSTGVFAGEGVDVKADSASAPTVSAPASKPSQGKQTSVQRTTKKTNWSKIKTLFE